MKERYLIINNKLLTVRDLSNRWGYSEATIRKYISDGIITPCKGVPGVLFNPKYINELEGLEHEPLSPWERKRLEKQIEELEYKYNSLKSVLANILTESSKVINL